MFTRKTTLHPDDAIAEILLVLFAHASGVLNRNGRAAFDNLIWPRLDTHIWPHQH